MTQYETKDSGARQQWASGMQRDTEEGKARFDLIIPEGVPYEEQLLTRLAMLLSRGAEKYDARNWEQATGEEEIARAKSSAFRHFMQWLTGEKDEDHAAATIFNLLVVETTESKIAAREAEEALRPGPETMWQIPSVSLEIHSLDLETMGVMLGLPAEKVQEMADDAQRAAEYTIPHRFIAGVHGEHVDPAPRALAHFEVAADGTVTENDFLPLGYSEAKNAGYYGIEFVDSGIVDSFDPQIQDDHADRAADYVTGVNESLNRRDSSEVPVEDLRM